MDIKSANDRNKTALVRQLDSSRPSSLGKKLDPALKSWMDNVIIPALVREYLAEMEKRNRLATTSFSEVSFDKDGDQP